MKKTIMLTKIIIKRQREYIGMVMVVLQILIYIEVKSSSWDPWMLITFATIGIILWVRFSIYDYKNNLGIEQDLSYKKSEVIMEIYKAAQIINNSSMTNPQKK